MVHRHHRHTTRAVDCSWHERLSWIPSLIILFFKTACVCFLSKKIATLWVRCQFKHPSLNNTHIIIPRARGGWGWGGGERDEEEPSFSNICHTLPLLLRMHCICNMFITWLFRMLPFFRKCVLLFLFVLFFLLCVIIQTEVINQSSVQSVLTDLFNTITSKFHVHWNMTISNRGWLCGYVFVHTEMIKAVNAVICPFFLSPSFLVNYSILFCYRPSPTHTRIHTALNDKAISAGTGASKGNATKCKQRSQNIQFQVSLGFFLRSR